MQIQVAVHQIRKDFLGLAIPPEEFVEVLEQGQYLLVGPMLHIYLSHARATTER